MSTGDEESLRALAQKLGLGVQTAGQSEGGCACGGAGLCSEEKKEVLSAAKTALADATLLCDGLDGLCRLLEGGG